MTDITFTRTLDGFTDIAQPQGGTMFWNGGLASQGSFQDGGPSDTFTANFSMTGSNWRIDSLFVLSAGESTTNLSDGDAGMGRSITYLNMGNNSNINLINSTIEHIHGYGNGTHDINLGSGYTRSIWIEGASMDITVNSGGAGYIDLVGGTADITVNGDATSLTTSEFNDTLVVNGSVGLADLAAGNNTANVTGFLAIMATSDGNDVVTISQNGRIETWLCTDGGGDTLNLTENGRIGAFRGGQSGTIDINVADDARVEYAEFGGADIDIDISGTSRIENLLSFEGNVVANVSDNGRLDRLRVDNADGTITMTGNGRVKNMELWEGTHTVTTADRSIAFIDLWESSSTINIGSGGVDFIRAYAETAQTHTITAVGWVGAIRIGDGQTAHITLGNAGAGSITTDSADDTIITGAGYLSYLSTRQGADTVTIGAGGAEAINTGSGDDTITAAGSIESLDTGEGDDDVTLNGYAVSINTREGEDTVTTGTQFVEHIHTGTDDDTVMIGLGGAGRVFLGTGDDTIVADSWVELVVGNAGNDDITLKSGGGLVRAGDGDDIIRVYDGSPTNGLIIQGGGDTDTLDFSNFTTTGVIFSLDLAGQFQNVLTGDIKSVASVGYFAETSVENLIGTQFNDRLEGDIGDNTFIGLKGRDSIFGGSGADIIDGGKGKDRLYGGGGQDEIYGGIGFDLLEGGKGDDTLYGGENNDVLRGAQGADIFVFEANAGTDKVKDFDDGTDLLRTTAHSGGFATLTIADQGGDLRIDHDGGVIILQGLAGLVLTSDDFEFFV